VGPHLLFASIQLFPHRTGPEPVDGGGLEGGGFEGGIGGGFDGGGLLVQGTEFRSPKQNSPVGQSLLVVHLFPHFVFAVVQSDPQRTISDPCCGGGFCGGGFCGGGFCGGGFGFEPLLPKLESAWKLVLSQGTPKLPHHSLGRIPENVMVSAELHEENTPSMVHEVNRNDREFPR